MDKSIRILLLEDSEDDAGLVEHQLRKAKMLYELLRVDTREEFVLCLDNFKPDVVLSDHSLPQFNSLEALQICQSRSLIIPFVMLTGAASPSFIANCLEKGARDCILKSEYKRVPGVIRAVMSRSEGS